MADIVVNGNTSGAVTLSAPAVAGTVTVTLPSTSGTMAVGGGTITTLTTTSDITVQGLTVGRGNGSQTNSTVLGNGALAASNSGQATAVGFNSLAANTTGRNVAVGLYCLTTNTTGTFNNAFGDSALYYNTTGGNNTAVGVSALQANTTAFYNTAVGYQASFTSTTATENVSVGYAAAKLTTTGSQNCAFGNESLINNTTGSSNTAVGHQSLLASTTSSNNTAVGYRAGFTNATGARVTYFGNDAGKLSTVSDNTFIGQAAGSAITTGDANTLLGRYNGNEGGLDIRTLSNFIVLSDGDGNPRAYCKGTASELGAWNFVSSGANGSHRLYGSGLNNSDFAVYVDKPSATTSSSQYFVGFTISGQTVGNGMIAGNGASSAAFANFSDVRLKENIFDLPPQLPNILALRPVEFDYIESAGGGHQIGFIAQEIEIVYPDSVGQQANGMKTLSGWSKTEARLVKAIQEQQAIIESLKARLDAANL